MPCSFSCHSRKQHADQWRQSLETTSCFRVSIGVSPAVWYPDRLSWGSTVHTTVSAKSAAAHVPACPGHPSTAVPMQEQCWQQLGNTTGENETEMGQLPAIGEQKQIWLQSSAVQQREAASASCQVVGPKVSPAT